MKRLLIMICALLLLGCATDRYSHSNFAKQKQEFFPTSAFIENNSLVINGYTSVINPFLDNTQQDSYVKFSLPPNEFINASNVEWVNTGKKSIPNDAVSVPVVYLVGYYADFEKDFKNNNYKYAIYSGKLLYKDSNEKIKSSGFYVMNEYLPIYNYPVRGVGYMGCAIYDVLTFPVQLGLAFLLKDYGK